MIKTLTYIITRIGMARKVNKLKFTSAGVDSEDFPYVEFDGLRFHGNPSREKDRKYYNLLSGSVKKKLPFVCFRTAQDIVIRYVEGGLMYGGPKKNDFYEVKNGDVAAEMGAFQGFYALKLCKAVGETGKVIAIEPMPDNLKLLTKNITTNEFNDRCVIIPKGVWKERSTLTFKRKPADFQSGSIVMGNGDENVYLPVDSLDNIMQEADVKSCDMMIIQLNGAELNALTGLNSIKPKNLAIAARYDTPGMDIVSEIVNVLEQRDYGTHLKNGGFIFASL